jgi:hypothetical protein
MKKLRLHGTLFILFTTVGLFAQPVPRQDQGQASSMKIVFYYTMNWELTTPERSFFRREANIDLQDMVFDGIYKDYDKENNLIAEGLYANGEKRGLQNEYFTDRSLKSTIEFRHPDFTIWEMKDENKEIMIRGGTGRFTLSYRYVSGLISRPAWKEGILTGEFHLGRRVGTWLYQDRNKGKTDEETYENGMLIKRIHFSDDQSVDLDYPKEITISMNSLFTDSYILDHDSFKSLNEVFERTLTYPAHFQRTISYPGGIKKLLLLLAKNAAIPEGHVPVVKIKVDASGNVIKYKVENTDDPGIKDRALKAVKLYGKRLFPAVKNGKPYTASIYLPVSGGQEWTDLLNETPVAELIKVDNHPNTTSLFNVLGVVLVLLLLGLSVI